MIETLIFLLGWFIGIFSYWVINGKDKEENDDWDDDKPVDKEPIRLDDIPTLDRQNKIF